MLVLGTTRHTRCTVHVAEVDVELVAIMTVVLVEPTPADVEVPDMLDLEDADEEATFDSVFVVNSIA